MRTSFLLLAGLCLLTPSLVHAQGAGTPQAQERKEIKVSEKVLQAYVGEYEFQPGRILTITLENGYLHGQPTDQSKRQLFPESQTKFFLKEIDAQLTFKKDAKGNVVGLVMDQAGRPQRELKKVK